MIAAGGTVGDRDVAGRRVERAEPRERRRPGTGRGDEDQAARRPGQLVRAGPGGQVEASGLSERRQVERGDGGRVVQRDVEGAVLGQQAGGAGQVAEPAQLDAGQVGDQHLGAARAGGREQAAARLIQRERGEAVDRQGDGDRRVGGQGRPRQGESGHAGHQHRDRGEGPEPELHAGFLACGGGTDHAPVGIAVQITRTRTEPQVMGLCCGRDAGI
jgi:hypothetical protein